MSVDVLVKVTVNGEEKEKWINLPCYNVEGELDELFGMKTEEIMDEDEEGNEIGTGEYEETGERNEGTLEIIEAECDEEDDDVISRQFVGLDDLEKAEEMANFFDGLASYDQKAFMAICSELNDDWDGCEDTYRKGNYSYYSCDSYAKLGYEWYTSVYGTKELEATGLENYIDWEAYGESLEFSETPYGYIDIR